MRYIQIISGPKSLKGKVELPSSKSILNRALILKALTGTDFKINYKYPSHDSKLLENILISNEKEINVGNSAMIMRFLTAYYSVKPGEKILTGDDRIKERPIGPLVNTLRSLGVHIKYLEKEGYLPLLIRGLKIKGWRVCIDPVMSSQFVSALLLIAPVLENGIEITLTNDPISEPYITMTLKILEYFGIKSIVNKNIITIKPQKFIPRDIDIEPDWSSASYIYTLSSFYHDVKIELPGLMENSWQGDSVLAEWMTNFGIVTRFLSDKVILTKKEVSYNNLDINMSKYPDLVPALSVMCSCLHIPFSFTGIDHLRLKESDRIAALANELLKIGAEMDTGQDYIKSPNFRVVRDTEKIIHTHKDHRMALSFGVAACKYHNLKILDPKLVLKSYPHFWDDLSMLGFKVNLGSI